jgi:hypothetical protein
MGLPTSGAPTTATTGIPRAAAPVGLNAAGVAAAARDVANAAEAEAAAPEPTPEDLQGVKDVLYAAVAEVMKQGQAEARRFVDTMAPAAAVYVAMQRQGDTRAEMALDAMKTSILMQAGMLGIRLQQTAETAFLSAVGVGLRMLLGPAAPAANAAIALGGALINTPRT